MKPTREFGDLRPSHYGLTTLVIGCAIVGAQRILLPGLYAYVCLIPFALAFIFFANKPVRNTLIVISLFLSVDNGGEVYQSTPGVIRYLIYLLSFYVVIENTRFCIKRCLILLAMAIIYTIQTVGSEVPIDSITFNRDIQVFILIAAIFCRSKGTRFIPFEINLLTGFLIVFGALELVNYLVLFGSIGYSGYMNYDSSKSLIVLVSFYYLAKKKPLMASIAFVATIVVLVSYGTRMIMLAYLATIAIFLYVHSARSFFRMLGIGLLCVPLIMFVSQYQEDMKSYKAVSFLTTIDLDGGLEGVMKSLDRVRYEETALFFSRDLYSIAMGSGFGSGLHDAEGHFGFISIHQTAFTVRELETGYFYNLHDTWIDIGLRFGFLFILVLYFSIVHEIRDKGPYRAMMAMNMLVLVSCASFSSGGLLLIALMYLAMLDPKYSAMTAKTRPKACAAQSNVDVGNSQMDKNAQ